MIKCYPQLRVCLFLDFIWPKKSGLYSGRYECIFMDLLSNVNIILSGSYVGVWLYFTRHIFGSIRDLSGRRRKVKMPLNSNLVKFFDSHYMFCNAIACFAKIAPLWNQGSTKIFQIYFNKLRKIPQILRLQID